MNGSVTEEAGTGRSERAPRVLLALVLAAYLALAVRLLVLLPLWGAVQDEPIHFGYAKVLAVSGKLPVISMEQPRDVWEAYSLPSAGDTAHHPPGYYFVVSLVLRLFAHASLTAQNYAARGTSTLLGLVALLFIHGALRRLLPGRPGLTVAALAVIALFPHWLMVCAIIHPEAFGAAVGSAMLWALALVREQPSRWQRVALVGLLAGLLALGKMTMLPFCLAAAVTVLVLQSRHGLPWRTRVAHLALLGGVAALVCGWWFVRNVLLYGQLMPSSDLILGTTMHTRLFLRDGSQDMVAFLLIPQGQARYQLAIAGAFRYFWCPGDWLPPAVRPVMYSLGGLIWLTVPVGLWVGLRRRQADLTALWRPFVLPFLGALALLYFMYLRWTVLVAIQAHAELGRWLMPQMGSLALMWTLAAQGLAGRRVTAVLAVLAGFLLVWDVLAMFHIATVLIPLHSAPAAP
ncbi:glycosyltransferase family 39 protein [bacterium]|nr:glycosyltransferase family 39 protein [bacterium]